MLAFGVALSKIADSKRVPIPSQKCKRIQPNFCVGFVKQKTSLGLETARLKTAFRRSWFCLGPDGFGFFRQDRSGPALICFSTTSCMESKGEARENFKPRATFAALRLSSRHRVFGRHIIVKRNSVASCSPEVFVEVASFRGVRLLTAATARPHFWRRFARRDLLRGGGGQEVLSLSDLW